MEPQATNLVGDATRVVEDDVAAETHAARWTLHLKRGRVAEALGGWSPHDTVASLLERVGGSGAALVRVIYKGKPLGAVGASGGGAALTLRDAGLKDGAKLMVLELSAAGRDAAAAQGRRGGEAAANDESLNDLDQRPGESLAALAFRLSTGLDLSDDERKGRHTDLLGCVRGRCRSGMCASGCAAFEPRRGDEESAAGVFGANDVSLLRCRVCGCDAAEHDDLSDAGVTRRYARRPPPGSEPTYRRSTTKRELTPAEWVDAVRSGEVSVPVECLEDAATDLLGVRRGECTGCRGKCMKYRRDLDASARGDASDVNAQRCRQCGCAATVHVALGVAADARQRRQ